MLSTEDSQCASFADVFAYCTSTLETCSCYTLTLSSQCATFADVFCLLHKYTRGMQLDGRRGLLYVLKGDLIGKHVCQIMHLKKSKDDSFPHTILNTSSTTAMTTHCHTQFETFTLCDGQENSFLTWEQHVELHQNQQSHRPSVPASDGLTHGCSAELHSQEKSQRTGCTSQELLGTTCCGKQRRLPSSVHRPWTSAQTET